MCIRDSARTAAESLKTNIFDLVLLDINLPDGNGYDLCRLIKPEHPCLLYTSKIDEALASVSAIVKKALG